MSWRRRAAAALLSLVCVLQMLAPCQCVTHLAEGSICCCDGTHVHLAPAAHSHAHTDGPSAETRADDVSRPDPGHHPCQRCRGHLSPLLERVEVDLTREIGQSPCPPLFCARTPGAPGDIPRLLLHRVIVDDWIARTQPERVQARLQI